eukprot:g2113.t1
MHKTANFLNKAAASMDEDIKKLGERVAHLSSELIREKEKRTELEIKFEAIVSKVVTALDIAEQNENRTTKEREIQQKELVSSFQNLLNQKMERTVSACEATTTGLFQNHKAAVEGHLSDVRKEFAEHKHVLNHYHKKADKIKKETLATMTKHLDAEREQKKTKLEKLEQKFEAELKKLAETFREEQVANAEGFALLMRKEREERDTNNKILLETVKICEDQSHALMEKLHLSTGKFDSRFAKVESDLKEQLHRHDGHEEAIEFVKTMQESSLRAHRSEMERKVHSLIHKVKGEHESNIEKLDEHISKHNDLHSRHMEAHAKLKDVFHEKMDILHKKAGNFELAHAALHESHEAHKGDLAKHQKFLAQHSENIEDALDTERKERIRFSKLLTQQQNDIALKQLDKIDSVMASERKILSKKLLDQARAHVEAVVRSEIDSIQTEVYGLAQMMDNKFADSDGSAIRDKATKRFPFTSSHAKNELKSSLENKIGVNLSKVQMMLMHQKEYIVTMIDAWRGECRRDMTKLEQMNRGAIQELYNRFENGHFQTNVEQKMNNDKNELINKFEKERTAMYDSIDTKIKAMAGDLKKLIEAERKEKSVEHVDKNIQGLQSDHKKHVKKMKNLHSHHAQHKKMLEDLHTNFLKHVRKVEDIESNNSENTEKLENLQSHHANLAKKLEYLQYNHTKHIKKIGDLESKSLQNTGDLDNLKSHHAKHANRLKALESKSSNHAQKIENLQSDHAKHAKKQKDLHSNNFNTTKKLENLQSHHVKHTMKLEDLKANVSKKLEVLESDVSKHTEKLEDLESSNSDNNRKIENLQSNHVNYTKKLEYLQYNHTKHIKKLVDLETNYSTHAAKLGNLQSHHATHVNKLEDLESKSSHHIEKLETLNKDHVQLVDFVKKSYGLVDSLKNDHREHEAKMKKIENIHKDHDHQLKVMEDEHADHHAHFHLVDEKIESLPSEFIGQSEFADKMKLHTAKVNEEIIRMKMDMKKKMSGFKEAKHKEIQQTHTMAQRKLVRGILPEEKKVEEKSPFSKNDHSVAAHIYKFNKKTKEKSKKNLSKTSHKKSHKDSNHPQIVSKEKKMTDRPIASTEKVAVRSSSSSSSAPQKPDFFNSIEKKLEKFHHASASDNKEVTEAVVMARTFFKRRLQRKIKEAKEKKNKTSSPSRKMTNAHRHYTVLHPTKEMVEHEDGSITHKFNDGVELKISKDGTRRQKNSDGSTIEERPCGTKVTSDGNVIITHKPDGSSEHAFKDGTVIEMTSEGHKLQKNSDGSSILTKKDGTKVLTRADGVRFEHKKNGEVWQFKKDGTKIVKYLDGRREYYTAGSKVPFHRTKSTKK